MAKIYVTNVKPTSLSAKLSALLLEQGFVTEYFIAVRQKTWDDAAWEAFGASGFVASTHSMKDCVERGITVIDRYREVSPLPPKNEAELPVAWTPLQMYEKDISTTSVVVPYRGWLPGMPMTKNSPEVPETGTIET